jgi:RND family efflux transporter MFP subunit
MILERHTLRRAAHHAAVFIVCASLTALFVAGCSRDATKSGGPGTSDKKAPGSARGKPPVAVEVAAARLDSLADVIDVVGSLAPKRAADIRSEVSGTVLEVAVTEWVPVRKGTVLARLDARESEAAVAAARAAVLQAEANEARAVREADRCERLRAAGLATQQMLDEARTVREAAAASAAAAKAQLSAVEYRLERTAIRAPFDGVVASRSIDVGDYVESMGAPRPLFQVVDNRVLDLTVTVPSTRSALLRPGQRLEFETDALPGRAFAGTVAHINPVVDETTRTIKVIAEVSNEDGVLRGGLFVRGRIEVAERRGVLQVPRAALFSWDVAGGRGELFAVEDGIAHRREVRTGATAGGMVEIASGLREGDRVVTRGGFNVRDGDRVTVVSSSS